MLSPTLDIGWKRRPKGAMSIQPNGNALGFRMLMEQSALKGQKRMHNGFCLFKATRIYMNASTQGVAVGLKASALSGRRGCDIIPTPRVSLRLPWAESSMPFQGDD